jgi:serine/threonine protein kinase/Tol biopolymer transport system component
MALTPGTILGQYEIRSQLGAGGMGEVYRAHDARLDREVAIKVLPESLTSDLDRLRRFEQEARAAAALNHPNILAVHQMATHEGMSYMVTELLDGETLRERLRRGPIPLRKAIDYGVQIANGLAAAHESGIVHRDLKPENLFLNKDGRAKILDFGLAKLVPAPVASPDGRTVTLQEETEPGVVVGTVGYMSPEQVCGGTADQRSDIFALGTILYEMVTGKRAFRKPTSPETMVAILNEDPPPISQLAPDAPAGVQRLVHRCLEKNPEERFYSAHDLAFALEALSDWGISPVPSGPAQESTRPNRMRIATAGVSLLLVLGAAVLGYLWMRPAPVPKVSNYVQLTHDGRHKWLAGTDGSRLYLSYGAYASRSIAEISISGGNLNRIPTPSPNMEVADISPDGAELLVVDAQGNPDTGPLWSLPVLGGSPRRLGDIVGIDGTWSPDGKMLAYCNGNELSLAKADGTEPRKLVTMKDSDLIYHASWSPDGRHLRFDVQNPADGSRFLWEIAVDGTDLHRLHPGWNKPPDSECCGRWTADGKYFVFVSGGQIWALPQKGGLLHSGPQPVQLTSSPLWLTSPLPSKDGKKLFVVGRTFSGELTRFDVKSGQFAPFLEGISSEYVAFSRDGQWVAYVSYPGGTLWRSKADGSERMQLTYPPNYAMLPRWSPDGKEIVFSENIADKPSRIYEISPEGGIPRQLMPDDLQPQWDPNWSPDGSKIVFGGAPYNAASAVRILDLASRKVSTLPGSQGLFQPRWSPDGRHIAAVSSDSKTLLLFDFQTQKWLEVATGTLGWLNWSKDGEYMQILDSSGAGAVLKIRLSDHKTERVVDLKNFSYTGHLWTGLAIAPDDSPLLLRDVGDQGVYALDWEAP